MLYQSIDKCTYIYKLILNPTLLFPLSLLLPLPLPLLLPLPLPLPLPPQPQPQPEPGQAMKG